MSKPTDIFIKKKNDLLTNEEALEYLVEQFTREFGHIPTLKCMIPLFAALMQDCLDGKADFTRAGLTLPSDYE